MLKAPLYIFDLDGTIALIDHRRSIVDPQRKPTKEDWMRFYLMCPLDEPNLPVIKTMMSLYERGCDIRIWSGRDEIAKELTIAWLSHYTESPRHRVEGWLQYMRPNGDTTPDHQLKRKWLNAMSPTERARLVGVFDDRNKVVNMWREAGVACFQVAPGDF
ncbi:PseT-like polynucleotide kinase phosphatase [Burkholderia phage Maja]|uniref:PseT-like polynucleotide kinase phosphatase n=1 Tax=Burkholderia phage Maja TaxID=2767571 RepID=A0A7S6U1T4_9CAUD|nr:PseT-like polynucleotide kinase phosphatase [Burkholderia phage Maja]